MPDVGISGVVKRFGAITAVDGIDLNVQDGEMVTLLGPSGCGKTTTLRMIAGLEEPDAGAIRIGGVPVYDKARRIDVPSERRHLGMVFQSYAIWPHMTVYENVAYPLRMRRVGRGESERRVDAVLQQVDLVGLGATPATNLSGGQQQRVALARAVVTRPKVLLMDEPLSNLDARLRDQMRDELRRIAESVNVTSLYVTHDQAEALSLGDRVCVMDEGEILQLGTPKQVYSEPPNLFVARFVGEMNFIPGRVVDAGHVESGVGTIACAVPPACAPGAGVVLGVRPEHIGIGPDDPAAATRGQVLRQTYLGDALHCQVQVGEVELTVKAVGDAEYTRDENVAVSLPERGWHVFPDA